LGEAGSPKQVAEACDPYCESHEPEKAYEYLSDHTDGRPPYRWKSRYPRRARRIQLWEAAYLGIALITSAVGIYLAWAGALKGLPYLDAREHETLKRYAEAWAAGTLGGTLFSVKWLYHAVARGEWHIDRRLWRWFTPHLSGGLAFAIMALASSEVLVILDQERLKHPTTVIALSFLVGYFSDNAIGALARLAKRLFPPGIAEDEKNEGAPPESPKPSSGSA
jgi:hypothetical protein